MNASEIYHIDISERAGSFIDALEEEERASVLGVIEEFQRDSGLLRMEAREAPYKTSTVKFILTMNAIKIEGELDLDRRTGLIERVRRAGEGQLIGSLAPDPY